MQEKSESFSEFSERTDRLAAHLGLRLGELSEKIGISQAMFSAYRNGKNLISPRAWRKLELVERESGLQFPPTKSQSPSAPTQESPPIAFSVSELAQIMARQNEIQAAQTKILERMLSAIERLERREGEPPAGKHQRRA